jgi:hypothetical protein
LGEKRYIETWVIVTAIAEATEKRNYLLSDLCGGKGKNN